MFLASSRAMTLGLENLATFEAPSAELRASVAKSPDRFALSVEDDVRNIPIVFKGLGNFVSLAIRRSFKQPLDLGGATCNLRRDGGDVHRGRCKAGA